jgi:hypothetical protein
MPNFSILAHQIHASTMQIFASAGNEKDKKGKKNKDKKTEEETKTNPEEETSSPKESPETDPSAPQNLEETTETGSSDAFGSIIGFLISNWWLILIVLGIIGINIAWKKLTFKYNLDGKPLPTLGSVISRTLRLIFVEDKTQVFMRPEKLAQKMRWLTWQKYWFIAAALLVIAAWGILEPIPDSIELAATIIPVLMSLHAFQHIRAIFRRRHRILMQMFEVASAEMRYPKGSELNPWGWVNITKWKDLYSPDLTVIAYPARFRGDEPRTQETFQSNFNGTVSDAHTWTYEWETANNRVLATPVPFITTSAPYPFPDNKPWDIFPLGIAAGGKEAVVEVSKFPHMLIAGTTGSGKASDIRTLIPVPVSDKHPSGWTTFGEIKVGDKVFDENGTLCAVTGLSDINETPDLYTVIFSDGSSIVVDADHLWWTETRQVRESRWNSLRKPGKRETLLPSKTVDRLRVAAGECADNDEVTVPELAAWLNVHPTSSWLYDIANSIGHVSEIEVYTDFHYAEQVVKQKQKVTVFNAVELWTKLANYSTNGNPKWKDALNECGSLASVAQKGDTVTSSELRAFLNVRTTQNAVAIGVRAGAEGKVEIREVELFVPAKTVRRKSPGIVRAYPKRELLLAVAEYGEGFLNDQRHRNTHGSVKTTLEILDTLYTKSGHANHTVPVAQPLDLPEVDLPIPPYTLGAWLGDGDSRIGKLCGIDWEVIQQVERDGFSDIQWRTPVQKDKVLHPDFRIWQIKELTRLLREQGLLRTSKHDASQKHIPVAYLRASISQRKALLAGLLDTDGTVSTQGTVEFANTNELLARQVHELALTLGYRATLRSGIKRSQQGTECLAYTVAWTCAESPFRLTRKTRTHQERSKNHNVQRNNTRFIVDIVKAPSKPARCIMVDSRSRLFLAGDAMIPTHNSVTQRTILLHALQHPDWRVVLVDPKRVELSSYKNHPNVKKIATELDESVELIEMVEQEMQSRYIRMRDAGVNHFKRLEDPPPALLLMVDELFALLSPENIKSEEGKERDDLHARAQVLIGSIARLGRAAGIHLALATQRPDAKILGGEVKALALDTVVPTPDGWTTMGEIQVGDHVFGEHGQPVKVVDATEVMLDHQVFEVTFSDGEKVVADGGHRWEVYQKNINNDFHLIEYASRAPHKVVSFSVGAMRDILSKVPFVGKFVSLPLEPMVAPGRSSKIMGTEELYVLLKQNFVEDAFGVAVCGVGGDDKNLFGSPKKGSTAFFEYVYGLLLGLCDQNIIDKETIISDFENNGFIEIFTDDLPSWVVGYLKQSDASDNFVEFYTSSTRHKNEVMRLTVPKNLIVLLESEDGIHSIILRSSYRERLSVLRGLMDSGLGFVYKHKSEYIHNRVACLGFGNSMRESVQELVASLGWVYEFDEQLSSVSAPTSKHEGKWRIRWYPNVDVFAAEETIKRQGRHDFAGYAEEFVIQNEYRHIVSVERVDSVPVRCIQVENDSGIYLVGKRFVPTHNSNLDVRIAQGRMDTTPSLMVLDSDDATRIPGIKGRAMVRFGGAVTEFQAYFLPEEALDQVLEMSAAIANGLISAEELLAAVQNSDENQKKGFSIPTRFLPKKLTAKISSWIEKRKNIVEANESRSARYRAEKEKQGLGKKKGNKKETDMAHVPDEDLDFDEVAAAAERSGLSSEGFSFFDENDEKTFSEEDEYEYDEDSDVSASYDTIEDVSEDEEDIILDLDDEFLKAYELEVGGEISFEDEEDSGEEETVDYYDENSLPDMDDLLASLTFVDDETVGEQEIEPPVPSPPKKKISDKATRAKPEKTVKPKKPEVLLPEESMEVEESFEEFEESSEEFFDDYLDDSSFGGAADAPWMPAEPVVSSRDVDNSPFAVSSSQDNTDAPVSSNPVLKRPIPPSRPVAPSPAEYGESEDMLSGWDEEHTI